MPFKLLPMKCLLVSATSFETDPFFNHLPGSTVEWQRLVTGVGTTATAYQLTRYLLSHDVDMVIQAGMAGTFKPSLAPAQVVAIDTDSFGDLGVEENNAWLDVFDLHLADKHAMPFTDGRLINPYTNLLAAAGLPLENAVTVSEITASPVRTARLFNKYGATIESMEGAAFHFVCINEKIPFIQLRSISNVVGIRDKTQWHIESAISALNAALFSIHQVLPTINLMQ